MMSLDALAFEQCKFFMYPPYDYTRDVAMVYAWCLRMTMLEGYLQSPSPVVE